MPPLLSFPLTSPAQHTEVAAILDSVDFSNSEAEAKNTLLAVSANFLSYRQYSGRIGGTETALTQKQRKRSDLPGFTLPRLMLERPGNSIVLRLPVVLAAFSVIVVESTTGVCAHPRPLLFPPPPPASVAALPAPSTPPHGSFSPSSLYAAIGAISAVFGIVGVILAFWVYCKSTGSSVHSRSASTK